MPSRFDSDAWAVVLAGAAVPTEAAANGWFVSAAAWISALLFIVFAIASAQILANMDFKQDSLLYSRAKTE